MIGQPRLPGGILVLVSLVPSTTPAAAAAPPPPAPPARPCCHFVNRTQSARNPANAANKVIATSFSAKPMTCISFNNLPASPALYLFCFVSKTLELLKHHEPGNLIISTPSSSDLQATYCGQITESMHKIMELQFFLLVWWWWSSYDSSCQNLSLLLQ